MPEGHNHVHASRKLPFAAWAYPEVRARHFVPCFGGLSHTGGGYAGHLEERQNIKTALRLNGFMARMLMNSMREQESGTNDI